MANVTNRENPQIYLKFVNEGDYDIAKWIIHNTIASIQAVELIELKYRKVSGDNVIVMTTQEKATRDQEIADEAAQALDDSKDFIKQFSEPLKAFSKVVLKEFNKLHVKNGDPERTINQMIAAVKAEQ